MNIGWLLDFCNFRRWLPKALRHVSHLAVNSAAAGQRGDQSKNNSQGAFATHCWSLVSSTQSAKPKEAATSRIDPDPSYLRTGVGNQLEQHFDPIPAIITWSALVERVTPKKDFRKQPSDGTLVDNQDSDWGSWAHADPELSALLKFYTPVHTIGGIDILQRTNEARS